VSKTHLYSWICSFPSRRGEHHPHLRLTVSSATRAVECWLMDKCYRLEGRDPYRACDLVSHTLYGENLGKTFYVAR
jgi:hypothetical protein